MVAMSKFKLVQLLFTCVISVAFGLECRPKGKCSCEMSDGSGTIDLTPLSNTNPPRSEGFSVLFLIRLSWLKIPT